MDEGTRDAVLTHMEAQGASKAVGFIGPFDAVREIEGRRVRKIAGAGLLALRREASFQPLYCAK